MTDVLKLSDVSAGLVAYGASASKMLPRSGNPMVQASQQVVYSAGGRFLADKTSVQLLENTPVAEPDLMAGLISLGYDVLLEKNINGAVQDAAKVVACSWGGKYLLQFMAMEDKKLI